MNNTPTDWLLQVPGSALADGRIALLALLLIAAAVIDYRTFRIPNWLTVGGTVLGLLFSTVDSAQPLLGFLWALGAAAVGLLILLPGYALRIMGAGDVKLMAMVGAFLGLPQILPAVLFSFVTGGIAALLFALISNRMARLAGNVHDIVEGMVLSTIAGQRLGGMAPAASIGKLPYGVSISAGTLLYLVAHQLGYL